MHDDVIRWLLENENPAIRYRTMTEILNTSPEEAAAVYPLIWQQKTIVRMLQKQDETGMWDEKSYGMFTPLRYLTAFAEFGLQKDSRLDRFVDYSIAALQQSEREGGLPGCGGPLLLRALVMLGYHERDEVQELISKFAAAQLYDGGFMCKRLLDKKPDRKSCYKAALAGLLLFGECKRKNILPANADKLAEYFLGRNVFYSSDHTKAFFDENGRFGWRFVDNFFPVEPMRMGLPLTVAALSILGAGNHPALNETWTMLKDKEDEAGRLRLEGTLTKQPCSFGKVGQANKWITLYAAIAYRYKEVPKE